jgi:hypothetical protein
MFQLTQARAPNNNFLNANNTRNNNNIRQFGRRLSYHFTRVLRKWKSSGKVI